MSRVCCVVGAAVIVLLASGCKSNDIVTSLDETGGSLQFSFTKDPAGEPVVGSGTAGWPVFPTDPAVIRDEEGYHLFYTSIFCNRNGNYHFSWDAGNLADCNIIDVVGTVGYGFSDDMGYTWEFRESPVIRSGDQDWHRGDIETPYVTVLGDSLFLFYSVLGEYQGRPFPSRYQVGAATLPLNGRTIRQRLMSDLADFETRPEPLLPYNTTRTSFDNNTQEPSVVVRDGLLEVYYVGVGFSRPDQHADTPGQSITSVGMAQALFDTDLRLVSKTEGYVLPGANITEVMYFNEAYHLFSTIGEDGEFHRNGQIGYFFSLDGTDWSGPETLLRPGSAFDNWGLMAPTVVVEDNMFVLFYSGWRVENHPCFPEPLPLDTRFGRPSDNNQTCIFGSVGRATWHRPAAF